MLPRGDQAVSFPDGPPFRDQGRVCLVHDTGEARWGATARLTHSGVGMLSEAQCERLGTLLLSVGHRDVIDRMVITVAERLDTIPITCRLDRQAHDVTDDNVATGRATGAYEALCGRLVVAAPVGRPCRGAPR